MGLSGVTVLLAMTLHRAWRGVAPPVHCTLPSATCVLLSTQGIPHMSHIDLGIVVCHSRLGLVFGLQGAAAAMTAAAGCCARLKLWSTALQLQGPHLLVHSHAGCLSV